MNILKKNDEKLIIDLEKEEKRVTIKVICCQKNMDIIKQLHYFNFL